MITPAAPCPFCGSPETRQEAHKAWCNECDAVGPADAWPIASGRRAALERCSAERRAEWQRAERAEAALKQARHFLAAFVKGPGHTETPLAANVAQAWAFLVDAGEDES